MNIRFDELGYRICKPFVLWNFGRKYHPTINGGENIPKKGPIILCGNHIHKDDQYNVMLVTRRVIHYMAKDEYFKGDKSWFYKIACCIPVNREIHDEYAKSEALKVLNNGGALGLFPEGTRNKTIGTPEEVDLLPFKFGAVSLASKTGAKIVPFGISGKYEKNGNLTCNIGEAFSIEGMDLDTANKVLREKILKLMKK